MVRTKWFLLCITLVGCVNALMEGKKMLNVRRVRRRRLVAKEEDRAVMAAIVANSNITKHTVPSPASERPDILKRTHAPKRKARLFR